MTQTSHCQPAAEYGGKPDARRYVFVLQAITIGWMLVEGGGSFVAAARARSLPIAAFASDSFVELLSAVVIMLQFGKAFRVSALRAARIAGGLLFLLTGVIVMLALLAARYKVVPERSYLGMGITLGALLIMPILAVLKRRHANATRNRALAADAVQSATCAYLAAITLLSLLLQAIHPLWWIDSAAVACLIPLLLVEARRAWKGQACGCC
ncbi:cation diffusion facilitator family transporter [Edaphobacter bradus]|uniref:cation transporter n=1 Tax=Edaphobacter bradus TaxID=2259016 RepID=UPI0021DF5A06|nr:cation transporter [Edaphobacter bradus]